MTWDAPSREWILLNGNRVYVKHAQLSGRIDVYASQALTVADRQEIADTMNRYWREWQYRMAPRTEGEWR